MDLGVLGPLTIGGTPVDLPRRDRVVFSVLALRAGDVVSADQLADALWPKELPASWIKVVQGCVVRLRKLLGTAAIETSARGYRLVLPSDALDVTRFERQVSRGRELLTLGEPDRAEYLLGEAVALWRGDPFIEVADWGPGRAEAARLEELRLDAEELMVEAGLRLGRHSGLLATARSLVERAPLRERRWALLALAQYQTGQQADALRTLAEVRTVLSRELGLDPGPDLVVLEEAIRRQDPSLLAGATSPEARHTCPYRGLVPYDLADAEDFYGRSRDVSACLHRIAVAGALTVVGPSGSGKSSLVRAGVAAALMRDDRRVVVITPGAHPLEAMVTPQPKRSAPVLVVDQCEEVLVLCEDPTERAGFFAAVTEYAVRAPVIVAVRADRLGDLSTNEEFSRLMERSLYLLNPMAADALREVIEGPARGAGLRLEAGLVDLLVREVEGEPGALPLLSHALRSTWQVREGNTLTVAGYQATGGVRGAVAQSAETVYDRVPEDQRPALRDLLLRLVAPSPDGDPVRSRLPRRLVAGSPQQEELIETLIAARLVTSDDGVVELAHEALVRAWPRLHEWLDEDAEGQRIMRHLVIAADTWDSMGRPNSELYRGTRLTVAMDWQGRTRPDLTTSERDFLDASCGLAEAEERSAAQQARHQRRVNRRLRLLLAAVSLLTAGAVAAAGVAVDQRREATEQRRDAIRQRNEAAALAIAGASSGVADGNGALALALAAEASKATSSPLPQATGALAKARLEFDENLQQIREPFPSDTDIVESVAFSPHGDLLAIAGDDGIRLWDPATGRPAAHQLAGSSKGVTKIAFSPDQSLLVGAGNDDVQMWDPITGRPAHQQLTNHSGSVSDVAFIIGGDLLAIAGTNGLLLWDPITGRPARRQLAGSSSGVTTRIAFSADRNLLAGTGGRGVRLWDLATRRLARHQLAGNSRGVTDIAFSADGKGLAGAGKYGVRLWDTATGHPSSDDLETLTHQVTNVAFSPDGDLLATALGTSVRLWDLPGLNPAGKLPGYTWVEGSPLAFSPNADSLAVVSGDDVRIWDPTTGDREGALIHAHTEAAGSLAFSPDGTMLASANTAWSGQGPGPTVRLWNPATGRPAAQQIQSRRGLVSAAFSPSSGLLATASPDGTLRTWDPATGDQEGRPIRQPPEDTLFEVAFSPDGALLASTGVRSVRLWDPATREPAGELLTGDSYVGSVAFSPDGELVASGGDDIRMWDLATRQPVGKPLTGQAHVTSVAFSPDGSLLASAGDDRMVRLWDPATQDPVGDPLVGHTSIVTSVAFSPDGALLASGGWDGTIRLWDPATRKPVGDPLTSGGVRMVAFSPNGDLLASGGEDGTVRLWDWDIDQACQLAAKYVTRAQLKPYVPSGWKTSCAYSG